MIINDLKNEVKTSVFSKIITIEDDDDAVYVFPDTKSFIKGIEQKKNAEKLHQILKRVKI